MVNAKDTHTPLPSSWTPTANTGRVDNALRKQFQSVIGSLLYLMLGTWPDIAFAVIKLSQFSANPNKDHLQKSYHILRYLLHTRNYELVFDGLSDAGFMAFCDSDWASNIDD